jgi:hypothetical protein
LCPLCLCDSLHSLASRTVSQNTFYPPNPKEPAGFWVDDEKPAFWVVDEKPAFWVVEKPAFWVDDEKAEKAGFLMMRNPLSELMIRNPLS